MSGDPPAVEGGLPDDDGSDDVAPGGVAAPPEAPAPEDVPVGLGAATGRALLGLVKLTAIFLPEVIVAVLGGVVGLVIGAVAGAVALEGLFSGPGPWARAGPIALVIPLVAALGPPLIGLILGVLVPPVLVLLPHSLVMVAVARSMWRDRFVALWATAACVWLPSLSSIGEGPTAMAATAVVLSPVSATVGFCGGALFVAARGVLDGRSVSRWWQDADGTMAVTLLTLSAYSWIVTWAACVLFCFVPTVPFALALAIACAVRLARVGRHRVLAIVVGVVDLAHVALLVAAVILLATGQDER